MSNAKQQALEMIVAMPDACSWEHIVDRITLKANLERGFAEIDAGHGIPHEQLKKEMREWLRSSGPVLHASPSIAASHPSIAIPT